MRALFLGLSASLVLVPAEGKDGLGPDESTVSPTRNEFDGFRWWPDRPGLLYRNRENPWIERVQLEGRFHYQLAHVDGRDVDGLDFNDSHQEFRRIRLESRVDFLKYFRADLGVNLVDDPRFLGEGQDLEWGFQDFSNAFLRLDLDRAFDLPFFEDLDITYGRQKIRVGYEQHQSSLENYTIERSAFGNRIGGRESRSTGILLRARKEDWRLALGYFNHDSSDFIGSWNGGGFFYGSLRYQPTKNWTFISDLVLNDRRIDQSDEALRYGWVSSLSAIYERDRLGCALIAAYGDNGGSSNGNFQSDRQGDFYGMVFMPWYWIVEDYLQFVLQFQYQGAEEEEGIRLSSRYLRSSGPNSPVDLNGGRGDAHSSVYLGLNYHLWGKATRIMGGLQFDHLETPDGDVEGLTYLLAFRTHF